MEFYIKPVAIPSRAGSQYKREEELKQLAIETKRPVLEINQVGSIDCWSYAGQSCACDENGNIVIENLAYDGLVDRQEKKNINGTTRRTLEPLSFYCERQCRRANV